MSKLKDIFSFSPKAAMMMGSCAAALFATSLYFPNTTFEDMPSKSAPQAVAADVEPGEDKIAEAKRARIAEVKPPKDEIPSPITEPAAPVTEPATEPKPKPMAPAIAETAEPIEAPKTAETMTPEVSTDATEALRSNVVTIERRVVKSPARTVERVIPPVSKMETRRIRGEDGTFKMIQEPVIVQEASTELVTIPPSYDTVRETVRINADGTSELLSSESLAAPVGPRGGTTSVSGFLAAEKADAAPVTSAPVGAYKVAPSSPIAAASSGTAYAEASAYDEVIAIGIRGMSSAKTSSRAFAPAPPPPPVPVTGSITADKAPAPMAEAGTRIKTAGKFTVFNGVSKQVVQSTETIISETGEILCRVMIPAKYRTITKEVLVSPARTVEREVPAETKDITVKVRTEDGSYKDVIRSIVVKEAWTDIDIIPAVYETRSERILVAPAREEWKPGAEAINAAELLTPKPVVKKPKPKLTPQSGLLTAGDYDDVLNPDLYKVYLDKMLQGQLSGKDLPYVDADQRVNIRVVDSLGKPVPMADITLTTAGHKKMFPLRTGADGMAYLYPNFDGLKSGTRLKISAKGARTVRTKLTRKLLKNGGDLVIDLNIDAQPVERMDLLLTIDATGSMGDEMRYLQSELKAIIGRVEEANPGIDIRTGLVVYRDVGDSYVVREVPFMDDIEDFRKALGQQNAGGGGDTPEAMHTALQTGLAMDWRDDALKVNLLVADAPPHDRHITETWEAGLLARTRGIHVVSLAASGVDKTAEFLMRSMAQITGGRYLFLTDDSGIGNAHAKPTVDCYVVTRLDGLVTRVLSSLIKGERVEPQAGEVIRSVGNYRAGTCEIDPQDQITEPLNVSYKQKR